MNEYGFKGEVIITSSNHLYDRLYNRFHNELTPLQGEVNNPKFVITSEGEIFYRYTNEYLFTHRVTLTYTAKLSMKIIDFRVICTLHIDNQLIYTSVRWE